MFHTLSVALILSYKRSTQEKKKESHHSRKNNREKQKKKIENKRDLRATTEDSKRIRRRDSNIKHTSTLYLVFFLIYKNVFDS